jgi:hypothetical protein
METGLKTLEKRQGLRSGLKHGFWSKAMKLKRVLMILMTFTMFFVAIRSGSSGDVNFAYYPSYGFVRVRFEGDLFRAPDGSPGLRGEYYPDLEFKGQPAATRVDETPVLVRRGTRAPAEGMPGENWTARWRGTYGPVPQDGSYEFTTWTDDGVRLWVDGRMIIDDWHPHPPQHNRAVVHLKEGENVPVKLELYQGVGGATCHIEARLVGKVTGKARSARALLTDENGKEWANQTVSYSSAGSEERIEVGELPTGSYTLEIDVEGEAKPFTAGFKRIVFPWEESNLGVSQEVYPPFKPIAVDGRTLRVVLREYTVGGLGLWDSVQAAGNVSAGGPRELLAAPMRLTVNGDDVLDGKGEFVRLQKRVVDRWEDNRPIFKRVQYLPDHEVTYEGRATHPAVTVTTKCTTEYDGCMRVELTLAPPETRDATLEALVLEIPLRGAMAPLFHATAAGLRNNPAGATPEGTGRIWDSRVEIPATQGSNFAGNFKPYIWLGAEERGLCWFADNDRDWVVDLENDDPCLSLQRDGETVLLRVHLVQKPINLQEPRTIVFGLMASPAKPMRADWRQAVLGWDVGHLKSRTFTMNYAADGIYSCKYPSNRDFSIFNKMQAIRSGTPVKGVWKYWLANNEGRWSDYLRNERFDHLVKVLTRVARARPDYLSMYFEEFTQTHQTHPASHVFQSEWSGVYHRDLLDQVTNEWHRLASVKSGSIAPSYRDFACWYAAEWVRRGIGCYFDNSFPIGVTDMVTSAAYRMDNGRVQPSAGMWARRDYLKRVWVLHQQFAPARTKPLMMIHMTNTHIIPYMVWNECNLDLEWGSQEPLQAQWSPELLRTESIGRQSGNLPVAMPRAKNGMMAMMVHEAGMFSRRPPRALVQLFAEFHYGLSDCSVYNYWDAGPPLQASDDRAKWLLLEHDGRLLLLVCTWNPEQATVTFDLDSETLGIQPAKAFDALTPEKEFRLRDGNLLSVTLPGYGTSVIQVE